MTPLELPIEDIEALIVGAFEQHLLRTGHITDAQISEHEYSYAIPEISPGPDRPDPEERLQRFRKFVMDQFEHQLASSKDLLHQKLCDEANYCKNKTGEGLNIVVTSLDGILSVIIGYPVPAVTVTAWLVKTKWLDKLCHCS